MFSKDVFWFSLYLIFFLFLLTLALPWPTHFQSEKWQRQCDYCGHDKSLARVHHLLSPDIISHNQHLPLISLTVGSRQLWLIWSFVVLRWCIMEYCEPWQASDHNWTALFREQFLVTHKMLVWFSMCIMIICWLLSKFAIKLNMVC